MKIYMDNCCIQRPLDTKDQLRIVLEADAVLGLIEFCKSGKAALVSSDVLRFEVTRCQNAVRRDFAGDVLQMASVDVSITDAILRRALDLQGQSLKPLDALHLASAEAAQAHYFCTCDDEVLSKGMSQTISKVKIVSPVDLVTELGL